MGPERHVNDAVNMIIGHEPQLKIFHFHYSFDLEHDGPAPSHIMIIIHYSIHLMVSLTLPSNPTLLTASS